MKPIETEYKGHRFRSRLEARWAVFFDACGVKWEYEPEGFDLGDGLYYLPDFLLHNVLFRNSDEPHDLWVEVKGQMTETDAKKIIKFANVSDVFNEVLCCFPVENPTLVVTNIPDEDYIAWMSNAMNDSYDTYYEFREAYPFNFELIDDDWFGAYPVINEQGRFVIMDDNGRCSSSSAEWYFDDKTTENAYRLARQARFEHNRRTSLHGANH